MKFGVKLLINSLVLLSVQGKIVDDSTIKTLAHLLLNFNTSLSVNAFLCDDSGKLYPA